MQFLWKYVDDLVGKGLDVLQIFQLMFFASARFVPLSLPLAVLISSLSITVHWVKLIKLMHLKLQVFRS